MRVLLLNPPGRKTYVRDYFCSKTTKSNYLFHPIDLVVLSGTVGAEHEALVLDCMAERLGPAEAAARIGSLRPDVVVSLVGAVSWDEDREFLAQVSRAGPRILVIGDVIHEGSEQRMRDEPWIEAALHVFSNADVLHYLAENREAIEDMTVREVDGTPERLYRVERKHRKGVYRVPRPRHELFPETGYHFSFARSKRFATLLTDYGCPYPCTFCVIGTLGWQTRPVADVLEEIDELRSRGVYELFVMDQTFGVDPQRAVELCAELEARGDLSWTTFTRPDTADDERLSAMRRAGCHTVIMGVESADDAVLERTRKGYRAEVVSDAFRRAKEHGLRTVGTFIIGLPEETQSSLENTLSLAYTLDMDFLSLNVAVPRFGTPFRAEAIELGLCEATDLVMDQAGSSAFLPTQTLDREAMVRMKKRMVRRFYLRPSYLWRRLRDVRSLREMRGQVAEGFALLRQNV